MTDGQSASLSWNKAPIWGLRPDWYYCQTVADLLMWGTLSLWREDGSVVYSCCWLLPVQWFSGPRPAGLVTIIFCLKFETSFIITSYLYDSQGYSVLLVFCFWLYLSVWLHSRHRLHVFSSPICMGIPFSIIPMLQAQLSKEKKGDVLLGCLGRTTLRRGQCDMWIHCIDSELLEHVSTVMNVLRGVNVLPGNVNGHFLHNGWVGAVHVMRFPLQRLGKLLFLQQWRCCVHDNGEMNCLTRCLVFCMPSRYKTECILEGTVEEQRNSRRPKYRS
jgi:hypothetical protein